MKPKRMIVVGLDRPGQPALAVAAILAVALTAVPTPRNSTWAAFVLDHGTGAALLFWATTRCSFRPGRSCMSQSSTRLRASQSAARALPGRLPLVGVIGMTVFAT